MGPFEWGPGSCPCPYLCPHINLPFNLYPLKMTLIFRLNLHLTVGVQLAIILVFLWQKFQAPVDRVMIIKTIYAKDNL